METGNMEAISAQRLYEALVAISRKTAVFASVLQLLEWDQETMMPEGASDIRAEQNTAMAALVHEHKTSSKWKKSLASLIDLETGAIKGEGLRDEQKAALFWWRRDFLQDSALPVSFVEEFTETTSKAMLVWREARKQSNFPLFKPHLQAIVDLCRKKADLLGYKNHPYDALLDLYEPTLTTDEVSELFAPIPEAVKKLIHGQKIIDDSFLLQDYDKETQLFFCHTILKAIGYDFSKGRLDLSTHPFSSSIHPTDSRVTTRVQKGLMMSCLSAALHEGGHSLYEMGLPQGSWGTPLGASLSLGMHESQSRWWECYIGQSRSFWNHFFPQLQKVFPAQLGSVDLERFYKAINKVEPSPIRVEADEVTYPLHVILRFRLEKQLIEGTLDVANLPEAWNSLMEELLGITPENAAKGCLQDVHWSMGAFGYFPTYALGNMYAAAFFESFAKEHSDWEKKVASGELSFIRKWLSEHVFRHGRRYTSRELVERTTGEPFSAAPYLHYLKHKYGR
jgi:carboxypeptidase Taq